MKARYLFLSVLAATALPIPAADASVLLIFGQTGIADTVTGTRTLNSTTITSSAPVDITEIDAPLGIPISATFTLNAHSISAATTVGPAPDIVQAYAGSFSIIGGGINYLSGTFSDAIFGSGSGLVVTASNPSPTESVTFTSDVIAPSLLTAFDRAASLSFTDVTPDASIVLGTLNSFKSDVSGDFSSTVPEPSTWAMMLLGFVGLGYAGFRKARSAISIA